jgi:hypothetical protein
MLYIQGYICIVITCIYAYCILRLCTVHIIAIILYVYILCIYGLFVYLNWIISALAFKLSSVAHYILITSQKQSDSYF